MDSPWALYEDSAAVRSTVGFMLRQEENCKTVKVAMVIRVFYLKC